MPDVVITEFMDSASVDELATEFEVLCDFELGTDRDRLLESLSITRALVVRNKTRVDAGLLSAAPELQVVARLGVGLDNIDVDACDGRGIEVAPATGANAVAVAEYVIGAMLVLTRGVFGQSHRVIAGEWPRAELRGGELAGKRLGLVGIGQIAREVAKRATSLGMHVAAYDPYVPADDPIWNEVAAVELENLFSESDAISIHVPLTERTRGLVSSEAISAMPPGALIVNTSRGGVVDEQAVVTALSSGHIGGGALDVFEDEPLDEKSGASFADVPNLILTPHIAGITHESENRIGKMTVATVRRHLRSR